MAEGRKELPVLVTPDITEDPDRLAQALQIIFDALSGEVDDLAGTNDDILDRLTAVESPTVVSGEDIVGVIPSDAVEVSDGVPPAAVTDVEVFQFPGGLWVRWGSVPNNDQVTYEVHVGEADPFTPQASTFAGEVTSANRFIAREVNGVQLDQEKDYFVAVVAKDIDGSADPSPIVGPTQIGNAADDIYVGTVRAEMLEAIMIIGNRIIAGDFDPITMTGGGRVEFGLSVHHGQEMMGIHAFRSDGESITFMVDAQTGNVWVVGDVEFGYGSKLTEGFIEFAEQPAGFATPSIRQDNNHKSAGVANLGLTWPFSTNNGNLLLAVVTTTGASVTAPSVTPPSGWTLIGTNTRGSLRLTVFKIENAAPRSGEEVFSFSATAEGCTARLLEVAGAGVVDRTASATGNSSTASTGTTATTTQAEEMWLGILAARVTTFNVINFVNPSPGDFTAMGQLLVHDKDTADRPHSWRWYQKNVSATGAASLSATLHDGVIPADMDWIGRMITIKAKAQAGTVPTPPSGKVRLYARDWDTGTALMAKIDTGAEYLLTHRVLEAETAGSLGVASSSYEVGTTGPTVTFVAPPSGSVIVHLFCRIEAATGAFASFGIDDFLGAADNRALFANHNIHRFGAAFPVFNLVPGTTYTARMRYRVASGTQSFSNRRIMVQSV